MLQRFRLQSSYQSVLFSFHHSLKERYSIRESHNVHEVDLHFSNGLFRFHSKRDFIISYFTPLTVVADELKDRHASKSNEIQINAAKSNNSNLFNRNDTIGQAFLNCDEVLFEFPDQSAIKLKYKGDPSSLLPWKSVELKTSQSLSYEQLKQDRNQLLLEFTPLFLEYEKIFKLAKWKESYNYLFRYFIAGVMANLIFNTYDWDHMEPVTFIFYHIWSLMFFGFIFHKHAHYVNCQHKLRFMHRINEISKKQKFDLHHFRQISDQLYRIEDKLQSQIESMVTLTKCKSGPLL